MDRRILPLLTIALLLGSTTAPIASAGSGGTAYAADWTAIADHLDHGNVSKARQIYGQTFQGPADEAPGAKAAVEGGFSALQGNASGTVGYAVAAQQVEKALLAVAAANVDAAVAAGDADEARDWFDVLHAKFGGDLSASKAAFDNATSGNLDAVHETFLHEYRDLITREVYHETSEVPELIEGGESAEAAKEAAEGRYYFESIRLHTREVLGNATGDTLTHELDELIDAAEAGDQTTAREEAGEILDLLAHYALATAEHEKADAYLDVKEHLEAEEVDQAQTAYEDAFAEEGGEYASAADRRIRQAFDDARAALSAGDHVGYEVQVQLIAKGILDVGTRVAFAELQEAEIHEALEYIAPVVEKFGWADNPSEAALLIGHVAADDRISDDRFQRIKAGVSGKFLDKVREEVDEVFIHWDDTAIAREKAIEGVAYYHPAESYVIDILGEAPHQHLLQELRALYNATTARDRSAADEAAGEVRKLLDQVESGGQEVTELDSLVNNLRGKIDFVAEEYRGYFEAKEAGDQDEAQTELGEAKAFTKGARQRILGNEDMLRDADSQAVDQLLANLDEIQDILNQTGDLQRLETLVQDSVGLLEQLKAGDVPATVTIVFGPAEAGEEPGTLVVPITLQGVPEDGFGFQARVTYDASVVTVTDVEVLTQVGSQTTSDGSFTFNAATTGAPGGSATVARVTFTVEDADPTSAGIEVEVQDLANAQGDPLGVESVDTSSLDLSTAGARRSQPLLPGPGAVLAVLALVAAGFAIARHRD